MDTERRHTLQDYHDFGEPRQSGIRIDQIHFRHQPIWTA